MTADNEAIPLRVLIVEDDEGLRNLILQALRRTGCETDGVATGGEALQYVMANPGLALLLDQKLPDMTGSDIIKTLNERGLRVPFIVMTGQGDERLAVEMMKLGAVDYLVKTNDIIDILPIVFQRLFHELENKRLLSAAEASLRKSEERNRKILQTAMDGFWLVDMQGRLLEVNNTWCKMCGYSEQELLGMRIQDLTAAGREDKVAANIEKIMTKGGEALFEESISRKDGSVFDVEVAVQHLPVDGGRLVVFLRDITGRKQKEAQNLLEQAVEERAKQLRQETEACKQPQELLQQENDTILLVDDEPHVISALTRVLRNSPYQLLTAAGAGEALEIMERTNIKVIVSDEMMEGMRGSELLDEVQRRFPHAIRILLTGHATLESATRAVNEGGIYRFFTKPWDESLLRLALSAATEKYNSDAERRRLQDALVQSEERYRTVVEQSPQAVVVLRNGTIIYTNPAAIRMFGAASLQDLAGKPLLDRVHPDEHQAVLARLPNVTPLGVISPMVERRYLRLDGSVFTGEIQGTPILYDGVPAFHLAIHDITDRKRMEKALRESEILQRINVYNRSLIEVSLDPLVTIGPDGRITDVNKATEDVTGYPRQKLVGDDFSTYFTVPAKAQEGYEQVFRDGFVRDFELELCHRDGSLTPVIYNASVYKDETGKVVGVFAMARDITKIKQNEEMLRVALEAAEVASRAKSLFIGNMSHELRTPLSGVLGMTEALLNTPVTEQQRDYAEKIRKSGKALLAVVGSILDFSKISAGNMALESSPFFVESVIENVVNLFGPPAAEEKIGLHTIIHPELPAVRGDAHRLTQVVSNLVGNAIKFTKAGEIRISVNILRRTEAEVELAIGVQDTGIGMTEEELSRIFTGFTQGDTSRGRRFGGTGLGLTISRNLVELMGGTLQVESVFGKGSLFTVLVAFPIAQGFVRMKSELKSPPANSSSAPITPVAPPKPERPPGDMSELQTLLEQLKEPLDRGEPRPCKDILATLLIKSWPEEQEILLAELNRLVNRYRLAEALDLLNKG